MTIAVANKRTFVADGTMAIYVGRSVRGLAGSPLGNPFRVGPKYPGMAAIAAYAAWIDERLADPDSPQARMFASLLRIARRGDLTLICWCHPNPCHANVIKDRLEACLNAKEATCG